MSGGGILLDVRDIHVRYGRVEALSGIGLRVDRGAIVSIIGANGAGKTTLMSALMGLLPVSAGQVFYGDVDVAGLSVDKRVAQGMALVPESRELWGRMTVADNLLLGAFIRRREGRRSLRRARDEVYELFPRLHERREQYADTLSGGERQMLALGRALISRPRLLMLDEPSLGLAPRIVADTMRTLSRLRDQGVSILLVEQNARAALNISDYGYVLETGRCVLEGTAGELRDNPRLEESYLGLAESPAA